MGYCTSVDKVVMREKRCATDVTYEHQQHQSRVPALIIYFTLVIHLRYKGILFFAKMASFVAISLHLGIIISCV